MVKLEANHIIEHLCGNREDCSDVIGIYPLFPDGTCRFSVFDFDNHSKDAEESNLDNSWIDEVNSLREICKINNIPIIVERSRSGHGAHIWIFFDKPVLASVARKFGFALLENGSDKVNLKSFKFYDRMIPAQDYLDEDGLEKINYMLLGPIRYQYFASEKAKEQKISHLVFPRFTRTICSNNEKLHINEYYKIIVENESRNKQLAEDIRKSIEAGRTPIVLTKFTKHARILYDLVKDFADRVFLLIGEKSNKSLREARIEMEQIDSNQSLIVIANGQLVGEGFDFPRLDTLFMADPVAWKGLVE